MRTRFGFFLAVFVFIAGSLKAQDLPQHRANSTKTIILAGEKVDIPAIVLDSGRISLFKAIDYYLEISSDSVPIAIKLVPENKEYIAQLTQQMSDCPMLGKLILKTKFTEDDLINIVHLYNNCSTLEKRKIYQPPTINVTMGAGISFLKSSFKTEGTNYSKSEWAFNQTPSFYLSLALLTGRKRNISLGLETSISNKEFTGYTSEHTNKATMEAAFHERFLSMDYHQFTAAFQFIYYSTTSKRFKPFYGLSLGKSFTGNAKTEYWELVQYKNYSTLFYQIPCEISPRNGSQLSIIGGVKTFIKMRYGLLFELRFDVQPNPITGEPISKSLVYSLTPTLRFSLK